jgi:hypothetical protein
LLPLNLQYPAGKTFRFLPHCPNLALIFPWCPAARPLR